MTKTYCDYCGEQIASTNEQANLDWHAYGVSGGPHGVTYEFHAECAHAVKERLEKMLQRQRSCGKKPEVEEADKCMN